MTKFTQQGPSTEAREIPSYQLSKIKFDHTDIRFTTQGETLYATALGWPPDGKLLIKSLAENSVHYAKRIQKVELLGSRSELKWIQNTQGLEIQVPNDPPCKYTFSFRILAG